MQQLIKNILSKLSPCYLLVDIENATVSASEMWTNNHGEIADLDTLLSLFSIKGLKNEPVQCFEDFRGCETLQFDARNRLFSILVDVLPANDHFLILYTSIEAKQDELAERKENLDKREELLRRTMIELETRVQERTAELENKNDDLKNALDSLQKTQNKLIESEKMAALGQLIAGIAHEINTPLGAMKASIDLLHDSMKKNQLNYDQLDKRLSTADKQLFNELLLKIHQSDNEFSSREQRKFKRQIRNKLLELGLNDAIEISDVLSDIGHFEALEGFMPLFEREDVDSIMSILKELSMQDKMSKIIKTSIGRASRVVNALKIYLEDQGESEMRDINVIDSLESTLVLHKSLIKQGVTVSKSFANPEVILKCFPNELNQVWVNLIHNALQAMEHHGALCISTSTFDDLLFVKIEDNGPGIPFELQSKIFDPFFTTKKGGQGTGLGLHLVQKIVRKHNGEINLESEPGKTTFTITIPGVKVTDPSSIGLYETLTA